jgi:hypothetical protein
MTPAAATDRCTHAVRGAQLGVPKGGARPRTRLVQSAAASNSLAGSEVNQAHQIIVAATGGSK